MEYQKPRIFTARERLIEAVRQEAVKHGDGYKALAEECKLNRSTISRLVIGHTTWPRHTTLFPLLAALGLELRVVKGGHND